MPPAKTANPAPRRQTRKRKRRAVSSSSSSSSPESSSSEDESSPNIVRTVPEIPKPVEESSESELDSDSSESSSNSGSSIVAPSKENTSKIPSQKPDKLHRSPSPSPPPTEIPSFLPPRGDASAEEKEKELKDKFRKFWMSSVADGFRDDLEELRKEPNFGSERLALLIDSLASGAEVFSRKADGEVSEMDVVMG